MGSSSSSPSSGGVYMGANGQQAGGVMNADGSQNMLALGSVNYGGQNLISQNAGMMDPSRLNPSASHYIQNINNAMPTSDWYQGMQAHDTQAMNTSLANQFAAQGMGGSSAEMGAIANANQNMNMSWMNRQLGDTMKASQMGFQDTMGIQNQYQGYQDAFLQSQANAIGMQQQQQQANNSMWGQLGGAALGAAGTIGGFALGGPAGAMAGSQLGSLGGSEAAGMGQSMESSGFNNINGAGMGMDPYAMTPNLGQY